jgi:hypothetical protein
LAGLLRLRNYQWFEQLLSGELSSLRMIAPAVGKSERYVSKVIRAAFLAPDLLEAVLAGRAPTPLTLAELTKDLPCDWNEQPRRFAVVLGANRTAQGNGISVVSPRCASARNKKKVIARL